MLVTISELQTNTYVHVTLKFVIFDTKWEILLQESNQWKQYWLMRILSSTENWEDVSVVMNYTQS